MQEHYFVSHATQDKAIAERLVAELEGRGLRCWIAPRDIAPGVVWATAIEEAIRNSVGLVLLLSKAANDSGFIHGEVTLAANNRRSIYPIRLEDVPPAKEFQLFIAHRQIIPLSSAAERIASAGSANGGSAGQIMPSPPSNLPAFVIPQKRALYLGGLVLAAMFAFWQLRSPTSGFVTGPSEHTPVALPPVVVAPAPVPPPQQITVIPPPAPQQQIVLPLPATIVPAPAHATIPATSGSAQRSRTNLDAYAPPPAAADTHGIIQNDQSGPLRPRINLGQ
jgi:TIR domain